MWKTLIAMMFGVGIGTTGSSALSPISDIINQQTARIFRSRLLTPEEVIIAWRRGIIKEARVWHVIALPDGTPMEKPLVYATEEYANLYKKQGFTVVEETIKSIDRAKDELRNLGYSEERIDYLFKIAEYFPTPPDLVRFAVREVYTPEIVEKFGQMEDLPETFIEEAAKAGLPEEQAKNYWAAHWELPSATQGFEMLHRRVITYDELKLLLRALDIMPFWRDKLIQISYSPLTRVDARRAWELEVISDKELYENYLDLGYTPENAERLTAYTKLERSLPYLREAYKKGWLTSQQFKAELMALGIKPEVVEKVYKRVVTADAADRTAKERDLTKMEIIKGVKAGVISEAAAYEMLQGLGYDKDEATYLMYIYGIVAAGDPQTELEMRAVVEKFKKMRGEPAMEITPEMIELDKQIKALKERIEKLKAEEKFDEAGLLAGELADKEYRLRQLMIAATPK